VTTQWPAPTSTEKCILYSSQQQPSICTYRPSTSVLALQYAKKEFQERIPKHHEPKHLSSFRHEQVIYDKNSKEPPGAPKENTKQ
jgi:hypothetical protein